MTTNPVVGRLAPSPTGLMHLGNAWAFWLAWLDVRSRGGRLILRMEDIDPARSRDEYAQSIRRDLLWLGLDWDEESPPQSGRGPAYEEALNRLTAKGLIYPCFCTRKELKSLAGAPQAGDDGPPYPGFCRGLSPEERAAKAAAGRSAALRLICPPERLWSFNDRLLGPQSFSLAQCGGDFPLRRSDGVFAYQLAAVVDDLAGGVTTIVRGGDILASTPRQLYLIELLGGRAPEYAHLPLILDHEGQRLAKRHQSLSLAGLREAGTPPNEVLGYLAELGGLRETRAPIAAADLLSGFDRRRLADPAPLILPEKIPLG